MNYPQYEYNPIMDVHYKYQASGAPDRPDMVDSLVGAYACLMEYLHCMQQLKRLHELEDFAGEALYKRWSATYLEELKTIHKNRLLRDLGKI